MMCRMFMDSGVPSLSDMGVASMIIAPFALIILFFKDLRDEYFRTHFTFLDKKVSRWAIYVTLFCMILLFGVLDGGQFIYVSF